jgi:hypothetical protein
VSERREAHEAVVSGKKYKVLTDPSEVHNFPGPRLRYMRPGLIIGAPYKESVVIGVDWSILLHSLKIAAKHDEVDTVDDDYFLVRVCPKTSGGITKFSEHEAD